MFIKRMKLARDPLLVAANKQTTTTTNSVLKTSTMSDVKKVQGRWFPSRFNFRDELKRNSKGTEWVIDKIVLGIANLIGYLDRVVVNDIGVNGPARIIRVIGISFRLHITGNVYSYALGMVIGTIGLVIFWWSQSV